MSLYGIRFTYVNRKRMYNADALIHVFISAMIFAIGNITFEIEFRKQIKTD